MKAVALSRDGARESHVVTKCFEVEKCEKDNQENRNTSKNDGYEFIDELERERKKVFQTFYHLKLTALICVYF